MLGVTGFLQHKIAIFSHVQKYIVVDIQLSVNIKFNVQLFISVYES